MPDSPSLDRVFRYVERSLEVGTEALFALRIVLITLYAMKERRLEPNTV